MQRSPLSANQHVSSRRQRHKRYCGIIFGNDPSLALLSRTSSSAPMEIPFFLEELMNALGGARETSKGRRAHIVLKGGVDTIPLPHLQAVVAARIDRLDENAKQVLETASVVGREISLSIRISLLPALTSHARELLRLSSALHPTYSPVFHQSPAR